MSVVTTDLPLHTDLPLAYRARDSVVANDPPLLLLLHGIGSNELDLLGLEPLLDERFHLVSARAPQRYGPGYAWFDIVFGHELIPDLAQAEASRLRLAEFIDTLSERFRVPHRRIFLLGFSQGAFMGSSIALRTPEKVGGLVAVSGWQAPEWTDESAPTEKLAGLPVLIAHGLYDETLPVWLARSARNALERLPVSLEYHEYAMGHEIIQECLRDIVAWLARQALGEERVER